jgi:hypothetical protein
MLMTGWAFQVGGSVRWYAEEPTRCWIVKGPVQGCRSLGAGLLLCVGSRSVVVRTRTWSPGCNVVGDMVWFSTEAVSSCGGLGTGMPFAVTCWGGRSLARVVRRC